MSTTLVTVFLPNSQPDIHTPPTDINMNVNDILSMVPDDSNHFGFLAKHEDNRLVYELRYEERSFFWNLYLIHKLEQYQKYDIHINAHIVSNFIDRMSEYRVLVHTDTQNLIFEPPEFELCNNILYLKRQPVDPHNLFTGSTAAIPLVATLISMLLAIL